MQGGLGVTILKSMYVCECVFDRAHSKFHFCCKRFVCMCCLLLKYVWAYMCGWVCVGCVSWVWIHSLSLHVFSMCSVCSPSLKFPSVAAQHSLSAVLSSKIYCWIMLANKKTGFKNNFGR
ncbi:hypothetical protein XENOCAPTIV_008410 [Xenoophorus captivus]|uniref:Uncharacterized protein n=1 Tax=Xenoophorus captivus TaxID=1517983 RepID=A0ABV0R7W5_9TELE